MAVEILTTDAALARIPHRSYDNAELIVPTGKRGFGKTVSMQKRIESCEPRILCLDAFDDFDTIMLSPDIDSALADMCYWPEACRRRLKPPIGNDSQSFANGLFERIIEGKNPLRNALLMLDEISLWSGFILEKSLKTLILQGRRLGIKMIVANQRLADVPNDMLSQATEILAFHISRPRDREVLEKWSDKETAQAARSLGVGECILINL